MDYSGGLFERAGEGTLAVEAHEQHSGMQSVQNLEAVINEGLRVALLEETPDQSLEVLLEHLGKALNGERTYIFEQNESGGDDNTYEWTAEGVEPEKETFKMSLRRYAPAGTGSLVSASISSLSAWKISGRPNPFSMKT